MLGGCFNNQRQWDSRTAECILVFSEDCTFFFVYSFLICQEQIWSYCTSMLRLTAVGIRGVAKERFNCIMHKPSQMATSLQQPFPTDCTLNFLVFFTVFEICQQQIRSYCTSALRLTAVEIRGVA